MQSHASVVLPRALDPERWCLILIIKLKKLGVHADSLLSWMAKSQEYKKPINFVVIAIN